MARLYHKGDRWKVYNYTELHCLACPTRRRRRWMLRLGWDRPIELNHSVSAVGRYHSGDAVEIRGDGSDPDVYDFHHILVVCVCGHSWAVDAATHEVHHPEDVL